MSRTHRLAGGGVQRGSGTQQRMIRESAPITLPYYRRVPINPCLPTVKSQTACKDSEQAMRNATFTQVNLADTLVERF